MKERKYCAADAYFPLLRSSLTEHLDLWKGESLLGCACCRLDGRKVHINLGVGAWMGMKIVRMRRKS